MLRQNRRRFPNYAFTFFKCVPTNKPLISFYLCFQLITVYRKYKRRNEKRADKMDFFFNNLGMLGQIFLYLVPGFTFFIFLPACIFVLFEGWDYVASIYYAFVTLTTIGFGDLVAGMNKHSCIWFQGPNSSNTSRFSSFCYWRDGTM